MPKPIFNKDTPHPRANAVSSEGEFVAEIVKWLEGAPWGGKTWFPYHGVKRVDFQEENGILSMAGYPIIGRSPTRLFPAYSGCYGEPFGNARAVARVAASGDYWELYPSQEFPARVVADAA